ncbi:NucA/NucB deoxyribonuclease domain-containing protein [Actinoplanes sp. NPDC089786]|uniref:NucA/NucB deoxyribonuclease domain-containing protein n=1 Tax=Actinoplanes sp. NPDC089786 TaxID=3155185 RepID=UPI003431BB8C
MRPATWTARPERKVLMRMRSVGLAGALLLAFLPAASANASPDDSPSAPHAFVEHGIRGKPLTFSSPDPNAFVEKGWRKAPATLPPGGVLLGRPAAADDPDEPPPPPTKEQCLNRPEAEVTPPEPGDENDTLAGWYKDRYGWCAWGTMKAEGKDAETGLEVAEFTVRFVIIGYGNNGARQFDYNVYLDRFDYVGPIKWDLATMSVRISGCNETTMDCPTTRHGTLPAWQAAPNAAFTVTSPEVSGGGEQILSGDLQVAIDFATPAEPEWVWGAPNGVTVAHTPIRYDSATYVGRARGAIFPAYRLTFVVDSIADNQDESALHIKQAFERPQLTWPSWQGKTVPGRTEPLTRMYNPAANSSNRNKSENMCRKIYGDWDSNLDNCDEFPFASTYEGSKTGPDKYGWGERYSVRLIDKTDNQYVGRQMLETEFYRPLRVLDGDPFYVAVR